MSSGILTSFLGAVQASLAVLLTIGAGVIASRYNLLKESSARDISKVCVRLFLPALLIVNVGSELDIKTASRYLPVLVWALAYTLLSMGLGYALKRMFKWPAWTVPAICFNNTTALPLLLIQALDTAGILKDLMKGPDDTSSEAVARAKSYFLVASVVGNSLTFALGPRLLDDEETPDSFEQDKADRLQVEREEDESDEEHANPTNSSGRTAEQQEEYTNEQTSLLPHRIVHHQVLDEWDEQRSDMWAKLPASVQKPLAFMSGFLNAPLIGAIIGVVIGLAPPLHKAFFAEPEKGGIFKSWLTASLKNVGELFAALQLIVVGSKLSASLLKMKKGEDSGKIKLAPVLTIFLIRFILWPIISIGLVFFVASKTNLLDDDPILWFVMMLLPTGPSATKLTALADVSGAEEDEKMSIAKFVSLSYVISPVICFAVVGSLKATLAIK